MEEIGTSFDQIGYKFRQLLFKDSNGRVIIFIFTFFPTELLAQTFLEFLMALDYLSENMSVAGLSYFQKLANACAKKNNISYTNISRLLVVVQT